MKKFKATSLLKNFLTGSITFTIDDPGVSLINRLKKYTPSNIRLAEGGKLCFTVPLLYKNRVMALLKSVQYTMVENRNALRGIGFLYARITLVTSIIVCVVALALLNTLIFRIHVEGIDNEDEVAVRAYLQSIGVTPLVRRRAADLDYATRGIVENFDFAAHSSAVIRGNTLIVRVYPTERPAIVETYDLVSNYDAIITEIVVLSGIPVVTVGDAVRAGQTLVHGAFQVGVEVLEPNPDGTQNYAPITAPTRAVAIIRGITSTSRAVIINTEAEREAAVAILTAQLTSENPGVIFDSLTPIQTDLGGGTFIVELVASRTVDLVSYLSS